MVPQGRPALEHEGGTVAVGFGVQNLAVPAATGLHISPAPQPFTPGLAEPATPIEGEPATAPGKPGEDAAPCPAGGGAKLPAAAAPPLAAPEPAARAGALALTCPDGAGAGVVQPPHVGSTAPQVVNPIDCAPGQKQARIAPCSQPPLRLGRCIFCSQPSATKLTNAQPIAEMTRTRERTVSSD